MIWTFQTVVGITREAACLTAYDEMVFLWNVEMPPPGTTRFVEWNETLGEAMLKDAGRYAGNVTSPGRAGQIWAQL